MSMLPIWRRHTLLLALLTLILPFIYPASVKASTWILDGSFEPTFLMETSPVDRESNVSVSREYILEFDRPIDPDSFQPWAILAYAGSTEIPARFHFSPDGRRVTLFWQRNLPASSEISVVVDGDAMRDTSGRPVDVNLDGQPGGVRELRFRTLSLTVVPGTSVYGRVFASELNSTKTDNRKTSINVPLPGVRIFAQGAEDSIFTISDEMGNFVLEDPPAGPFFVYLDGRTVSQTPSGQPTQLPGGPYYPFVGKLWISEPGVATNVGDVFLPLVQEGTLQVVSADEDTVITFAPEVLAQFPDFSDVRITVPADSLFSSDGNRGGRVGIAPVPPDRLPEPLPPFLDFPIVITVQTDGPDNFDLPAPICFPNLPDPVTGEVAPPGTALSIWSFNHDRGLFEVSAAGTVSEDGRLVCSNPGEGIRQPGWHGVSRSTSMSGGGASDGRGFPNRGPNRGDAQGEEDPCEVQAELALSAKGQCAAAIALPVMAVRGIPLLGCALGFGAAAAGMALDCEISSEACQNSIGINSLAAVAGCVPGVGGVLGAAITCGLGAGLAELDLIDCQYGSKLLAEKNRQLLEDLFNDERIGNAPYIRQLELLVRAADIYTLVFGDAIWTEFDPEDIPLADAFFEALRDALEDDGPGGRNITTDERADLMEMPLPAKYTSGIRAALLDRMERMAFGQLGPGELDIEELSELGARLLAVAERAQESGWVSPVDGLAGFSSTYLASHLVDPNLGPHAPIVYNRALGQGGSGGVGFGGGGQSVSASFPFPSTYFNPRPRPMLYRVTDTASGFQQFGETNDQGTFDRLIVTPNSLVMIEYVDRETFDYAQVIFRSGEPGTNHRIPPALFIPAHLLPDTDGDGLPDIAEAVIGTDPFLADTNGDGVEDGAAVRAGSDPLSGLGLRTGLVAAVSTEGSTTDMVIANETVFTAEGMNGIGIYNTFNGMAPVRVGQIPAVTTGYRALSANNNFLAASELGGALHLYDITNPLSPLLMWSVTGQFINKVALTRDKLYTSSSNQVRLYDVSNGELIEARSYHTGNIVGMVPFADFLYLLHGQGAQRFLVKVPIQNNLPNALIGPVGLPATSTLNVTPIVNSNIRVMEDLIIYTEGISSDPDLSVGVAVIRDLGPSFEMVASPGIAPAAAFATNGFNLAVYGESRSQVEKDVGVLNLAVPSAPSIATVFPSPSSDAMRAVVIHHARAYMVNSNTLYVYNYQGADQNGIAPNVEFVVPFAVDGELERSITHQIRVRATDDVDIRHVDLLVDGVQVQRLGSYPYHFDYRLPLVGPGTIEFSVRATDTGGNSTTTPVQAFTIVNTIPPVALSRILFPGVVLPVPGTIDRLEIPFSQALDPDAINLAAISIIRQEDGIEVPVSSVNLSRSNVLQIVLEGFLFEEGVYQVELQPGVVQNLDGTATAAGYTDSFTILPPFPANANVWITPSGGLWSNRLNWSRGRVPIPGDHAIISQLVAGASVVVSQNTVAGEVTAGGRFVINNNVRFSMGGASNFFGEVVLDGVSSILAVDPNGNVTLNGPIVAQGGRFEVAETGVLTINPPTPILAGLGTGPTNLNLSGTLHLPNITALNNMVFQVFGTIDAPNLQTATVVQFNMTDPKGIHFPLLEELSRGSWIQNGGLEITLPAMERLTAQTTGSPIIELNGDAALNLPALTDLGTSRITALGNSRLSIPEVTNAGSVNLTVNNTAEMVLSNLTEFRGSLSVLNQGVLVAPSLESLLNASISLNFNAQLALENVVSASNTNLSASNNAVFTLGNLTSMTGGGLTTGTGGELSIPSITTLDGVAVRLQGVSTLNLPSLHTYENERIWITADGTLTPTFNTSLQTLRAATVQVDTSAEITLSVPRMEDVNFVLLGTAQLVMQDVDFYLGGGLGRNTVLNGSTNLLRIEGVTEAHFGAGQMQIFNSSRLEMPDLERITGGFFRVGSTGVGATPRVSFPVLTHIESDPEASSPITFTFDNPGAISEMPALQTLVNTQLVATFGGTFTFPATTFTWNRQQATGLISGNQPGTVMSFPNLQILTYDNTIGSLAGTISGGLGEIDLTALQTIETPQADEVLTANPSAIQLRITGNVLLNESLVFDDRVVEIQEP